MTCGFLQGRSQSIVEEVYQFVLWCGLLPHSSLQCLHHHRDKGHPYCLTSYIVGSHLPLFPNPQSMAWVVVALVNCVRTLMK